MSLEEANKIVTMEIEFIGSGWAWRINTHRPFGCICGYKKYPTPGEAEEELKGFLRYFTENVLKDGDTIRKYVEKHRPKKEDEV